MNSESRPNILFIITDQLRADCIGALGNTKIKTPNIDRLVREGTSFESCYTPSPVCAPARHSLTSGVPPHVTGCVDNAHDLGRFKSVMECLVEKDYQTHGVGKMHFTPDLGDWGFTSRDVSEELQGDAKRDDYRDFLKENGYGHVLDPHGLRSEFYYLPQPSQLPEKLHNSHWVADRSIDFLKNRDASKPFFLWTSFIKPHPPFESPNPWGRLYRMHEMDQPLLPDNGQAHGTFWNKVQNRYKYMEDVAGNRNLSRSIKAAYYGTISFVDYNIGRILDSLGSEIDNTLIVFTSDHGEMLGDFGFYGKRSMLNASVRVPMIARYPGVFPENRRCGNPTTLLDLFPTFMSLAGSHERPQGCEGVSLVEAMDDDSRDRIVFSHFSRDKLGLYMAASKDWKYVYSAPDDKEWLFDLRNDPEELINKADDPSFLKELEQLKNACIQRFRSDGYLNPLDNYNWKRFAPTEVPAPDTDVGLLFQDPQELKRQIEELGAYSKSSEFMEDEAYRWLRNLYKSSQNETPSDNSPKQEPSPETSEIIN